MTMNRTVKSRVQFWFRQHGLHHPVTADGKIIRLSVKDPRFRVLAFPTRVVAKVYAFLAFRVEVQNTFP